MASECAIRNKIKMVKELFSKKDATVFNIKLDFLTYYDFLKATE